MKYIGMLLILTAVAIGFRASVEKRIRQIKRAEESLAFLTFLENAIRFLAPPLGEILEAYMDESSESELFCAPDARCTPEMFLRAESDATERLLRALLQSLGASGGETAEKTIEYYRQLLEQEAEGAKSRFTRTVRVGLPVTLSLTLLTVILLY